MSKGILLLLLLSLCPLIWSAAALFAVVLLNGVALLPFFIFCRERRLDCCRLLLWWRRSSGGLPLSHRHAPEVESLVEAGLEPWEALAAATWRGGDLLGELVVAVALRESLPHHFVHVT